jgi:hypothetical protein
MFGKNKQASGKDGDRVRAFEAAKEAARRAAFLNTASNVPEGQAKQDLALLFRVCRASALAAGEAVGQSQSEVDAAISAMCDADVARLKKGSDRALQEFGRESDKIARAYLLTVDPDALAAWTQPGTRH